MLLVPVFQIWCLHLRNVLLNLFFLILFYLFLFGSLFALKDFLGLALILPLVHELLLSYQPYQFSFSYYCHLGYVKHDEQEVEFRHGSVLHYDKGCIISHDVFVIEVDWGSPEFLYLL